MEKLATTVLTLGLVTAIVRFPSVEMVTVTLLAVRTLTTAHKTAIVLQWEDLPTAEGAVYLMA